MGPSGNVLKILLNPAQESRVGHQPGAFFLLIKKKLLEVCTSTTSDIQRQDEWCQNYFPRMYLKADI